MKKALPSNDNLIIFSYRNETHLINGNIKMNLSTLVKAMNEQVIALGGQDVAIAACDRMYSQTFRSESFPLNEIDDWEEEVYSLKQDIIVALFVSETGAQEPTQEEDEPYCSLDDEEEDDCDDSHFYMMDSYHDEMQAFHDQAERWFEHKYPDFDLDGDCKVVEFTNYKGEGEGFGLYELNKSLPVFKSKRESWNQVN